VDVDESRRDDQSAGIDYFPPAADAFVDCDDSPVVNGQVGREGLCAGTIDDGAGLPTISCVIVISLRE